MSKFFTFLILFIVFSISPLEKKNWVFAEDDSAVDQVRCGCTFEFTFLTETGNACAEEASCLNTGTELQTAKITATSKEDGGTKFELGPFKQGEKFGVSFAGKALQGLSNFEFYEGGMAEVDGKYNVYFFPQSALDKLFPGIKIAKPDGSSDWELDLAHSPICMPTSQGDHQYAFETQGKYVVANMDCGDDPLEVQGELGSGSDWGSNGKKKAEVDPIVSMAKSSLNRIGTTDIKTALGRAISVAMGVMGSIAVAMFVYAGLLFMVSGTAETADKARSILVWSSLGIIVIFASYALVQLIFKTFV